MVSFFSKLQVPEIAFIRAFWVFLLYPPYTNWCILLLLPLWGDGVWSSIVIEDHNVDSHISIYNK